MVLLSATSLPMLGQPAGALIRSIALIPVELGQGRAGAALGFSSTSIVVALGIYVSNFCVYGES